MNATLQRFGFPGSMVKGYEHWVVMIRPAQVTLGCAIIAAKSQCTSFGDLSPEEAAELPLVMGDYERAVRRMAPAQKFNYLALMMSDPNPHFHAIPRYAHDVTVQGVVFTDAAFPKPPDVSSAHLLTDVQVEGIRRLLAQHWDAV